MAFLGINTDENVVPSISNYSTGTYTKGDLVYVTSGSTRGAWLATQSSTNIAPAFNSHVWNEFYGPYWVDNGNDRTLTTPFLSTFTHDKFTGSVFHNGATSGTLYIQQSGDGKNWGEKTTTAVSLANDISNQTFGDNVTGHGAKFSEEIILPYIRFKFITGSDDVPAIFRLFGRTADSGVKY